MKKTLSCMVGALAIAGMALTPSKASAGWGWWGRPGVSITIGPRYGYGYYGNPYGYYGYRPYAYYGYRPYGYYGYRPYRRYAYRGWDRW